MDRVKRFYWYSPQEMRALFTAILMMSFMASFSEWGVGDVFNAKAGMFNWFNAFLIMGSAMLVQTSVQRFVALSSGFRGEFKVWYYGLFLGLIITFLTRGTVWWFLAPGGLVVYHLAVQRLGYYRYGLTKQAYGISSMSGPLANIVFALLLSFLVPFFPDNALLGKAIAINLWLGIVCMLPIPPLSGAHMFIFSRLAYVFTLGAMIGMAAMIALHMNLLIILLMGILLGWVAWFMFYLNFEKEYWEV